jgi:hypothetical protein
MTTKAKPPTHRIHGAGLIPASTPLQKTWCGRRVTEEQLPLVGTDREVNCKTCLRIHAPRAEFWRKAIRRSKYRERKAK